MKKNSWSDMINSLLQDIDEILKFQYKEYYHGKAMAKLDACYMIWNFAPQKTQEDFDRIWEKDKEVNAWQQLTK